MPPSRAAAAAPLLLSLLFAPMLLLSCEDPTPLVIGKAGAGDGEFDTPRGISAAGGRVAVVDRSGRCQVFDADGTFRKSIAVMPPGARRGFPLGVLLEPEGSLWVIHTHDAALVHYGADGKEDSRWGVHGVKDGELGQPQRAVLSGGRFLVSDFGYEPCRRIQRFAPGGAFEARIGGPGTEAIFERPMGMAIDEKGVLWVADAAGKLFRFEPKTGRLLGSVGSEGAAAGQTQWPTGVAPWPGGGVVVCEAGNHRLQRFDAEGKSLGVFGRNGTGPGEFRTPYDLAVDPPWLYVADTDNHRVQRFRISALPWTAPGEAPR
jgi:streptogramin lyase